MNRVDAKTYACQALLDKPSGRKVCDLCGISWKVNTTGYCAMRDMSRPRHLSDTEHRLLVKLQREPNAPIRLLYKAIYQQWPEPTMSTRTQQQRIGSYISRLSAKLAATGKRIVPGGPRNTYSLVPLASDATKRA